MSGLLLGSRKQIVDFGDQCANSPDCIVVERRGRRNIGGHPVRWGRQKSAGASDADIGVGTDGRPCHLIGVGERDGSAYWGAAKPIVGAV
jgi:hypothetical protein